MRTKLNNKGMSLVELLIAIAIAAVVSILIVTMMTSGTRLFRQESKKIDVQNDVQVIQNQITDILRQAKQINVVKAGEDIRIYTGEVNPINNKLVAETFATGKYTDTIITYVKSEKSLYVTSSYMENIPEGYLLSNNVTAFDIAMGGEPETYVENMTNASGVEYSVTHSYYENPICVVVEMDIDSGKDKKNVDMTVKLRNEIEHYYLYNADTLDEYLFNVTPMMYEIR